MSIIMQIADMIDRMQAENRVPGQLLIGNLDAAELEAELNAFPWSRREPGYIVNLTAPAQLLGVPVKRVDQDRLLGVVAEGFED